MPRIKKTKVEEPVVETKVEEVVEKKPAKKLEIPVRMFFNLDGESGYRPTPVIVQDEELHLKLLRTAKNELDEFIKKYSILTELQPLIEEIEHQVVKFKIFEKVS